MKERQELSSDHLKQSNTIVEAMYRMESHEQLVMLLAFKKINQLEQNGVNVDATTAIDIDALDYARVYGVSRNVAFNAILSAQNNIFERQFTWRVVADDGTVSKKTGRWIHTKEEVETKSKIRMYFSPTILPFASQVEKNFTLIDLRQTSGLGNKFAMRLFQLLLKWKNAEYAPIFDVQTLKLQLGVDVENGEYALFSDFRKNVIEKAVKKINTKTNIFIKKVAYKKDGRAISHISFLFDYHEGKNITPDNGDDFALELSKQKAPRKPRLEHKSETVAKSGENKVTTGMSEDQAQMYADKIIRSIESGEEKAAFKAVAGLARVGEKMLDFKKRIKADLIAGELNMYRSALKELGCSVRYTR